MGLGNLYTSLLMKNKSPQSREEGWIEKDPNWAVIRAQHVASDERPAHEWCQLLLVQEIV